MASRVLAQINQQLQLYIYCRLKLQKTLIGPIFLFIPVNDGQYQ